MGGVDSRSQTQTDEGVALRVTGKFRVQDSDGNVINPATEETLLDIKGDYAINVQVDSGDSNVEYIGIAPIGSLTSQAVWQIKKVNYTTGTIITWADSDKSSNNIFDDRESLSYG